jgi:hypothetical protein
MNNDHKNSNNKNSNNKNSNNKNSNHNEKYDNKVLIDYFNSMYIDCVNYSKDDNQCDFIKEKINNLNQTQKIDNSRLRHHIIFAVAK